MKNKGFMLIETLVASTIILGALTFLFIQFSSIKRSYENSFKYNSIPGLYNGKILADFLSKNGTTNLDKTLNKSTKGYVQLNGHCILGSWNTTQTELCTKIIEDIQIEQVLYIDSDITNLQNDIKNNNYDQNVFNTGFKKFVLGLEPISSNHSKRIIINYKNNTYAIISIN